jgi:site-specific DNA recombinase
LAAPIIIFLSSPTEPAEVLPIWQKATGVHIADVSRLLPLAFLAPAQVDAILTGRHPVELTARQLSHLGNLPVDRLQQRKLLGF